MWIICYSLILITLQFVTYAYHQDHQRQRRYLIFTKSTQYGTFATVSIPLHSESTVSVAWFFEANYYNVDNATYFEPLLGDIDTISRGKVERSVDRPKNGFTRTFVYTLIETMLQRHEFEGRPCLLRAICENASTHFLHNGVLGDLLHLVLTPSTSMSEETLEDVYYEAEYYGLDNKCEHYTRECLYSPLDTISLSVDDLLKI